MTDQKHPDPDRYALVIEGVRWEFRKTVDSDLFESWNAVGWRSRCTDQFCGIAPTHAPAILDIVAKWHEDRRPKMRRKVVECDGELFCVTLEGGISHCDVWHGPEKARQWALDGDEDHSAAQVRVMADLIANPDEPEPTDGN